MKTIRARTRSGLAIACASVFLTAHAAQPPPHAAPSREQMLLDILYQNHSINRAQYEQLSALYATNPNASEEQIKAAQEAGRTAAEAEIAKARSAPGAGKVVVNDGIGFESNDGNFSLAVGGRVQADGAVYDDDQRMLGDGSLLRRARLRVNGTFYKNWQFWGEYDFQKNATTVADAFLRYVGFKPFTLTAGHFKPPFSLEDIQGDTDITFMERSLPSISFTPVQRRVGAMADYGGRRFGAAVGVFGEQIGSNGDFVPGDESDAGLTLASRITGAPILSDHSLLHVGGSFQYRNANPQETTLRFASLPESNVTAQRLVDTGLLMDINKIFQTSAEFMVVAGPWYMQGEYFTTDVERKGTSSDLWFDGWYLQSSVFLTGESLAKFYDPAHGIFTSMVPKGPYGAIELALRYSTVDLNDSGVVGGDADALTFAINWYLNKRIRLGINYINVLHLAAAGTSFDHDEPSALTARAQVVF